ncbi:TlpA disulfide reductase family protein [Brevundimonas sp. 2R-24]|uniref:TlpA disulfide reductase family protein n=1 Tax=Peiella sedimenti TaxID=3061083 RepID=A0ABT8SHI4_9CAUL|nr:TlpA disulfide reductase family protein [Caulobacteraceae bacterium XZ-24]
MGESGNRSRGGPSAVRWFGLVLAALTLAVAAFLAFLYAKTDDGQTAQAPAAASGELARFASGPLARLQTSASPRPAPDYSFQDAEGNTLDFAAFRGQVTVVNLWAMWCLPCRTELPTLAALAEAYEDRGLRVVAVNVEQGEAEIANARSFIGVHEPLAFYSDPRFELPFRLFEDPADRGKMPQTVILDREGHIVAGLIGEADWNSPEARALIEHLLAQPT